MGSTTHLRTLPRRDWEIASNRDPSQCSGISWILLENLQLGRGHGWMRNSTRQFFRIHCNINALLGFLGGVNIARDFTVLRGASSLDARGLHASSQDIETRG